MPTRDRGFSKSMIRKLWGEFNDLFHEEATQATRQALKEMLRESLSAARSSARAAEGPGEGGRTSAACAKTPESSIAAGEIHRHLVMTFSSICGRSGCDRQAATYHAPSPRTRPSELVPEPESPAAGPRLQRAGSRGS